jgi:hypothetical protein
MKTLLTLTLVVLMAGSAFAQLDNSMGIFFVDSGFDNPDDAVVRANTNFDPAGGPFNAYVCMVGTTMFSIAAYEVGIEITDPAVFVLGVTGPNGWTNFGNNTNHLAGYMTPLPCSAGYCVLSTMNLLYSGAGSVEMIMGPASPSSVDEEGPALADGANVDILYVCNYTSGPSGVGVTGLVATLNGEGITFPGGVATQAQSLSSVKALFN